MTKFNLIKKITSWYGFEVKEDEKSLKVREIGTDNSYEFKTLEDALKAFCEIMITTNDNLKSCHYQIWSDDELAFIASLLVVNCDRFSPVSTSTVCIGFGGSIVRDDY